MTLVKLLFVILKHLPQILALIEVIEKGVREAETKRKVADDLNKIAEAFKEKDAKKLNDIFNS